MKKIALLLLLSFFASCESMAEERRGSEPPTAEDEVYFLRIKKAIEHNKRAWVLSQVQLPVAYCDGKKARKANTPAQFLRAYDNIIHDFVKR